MRIHLGHHFYGAGNLGDDFMLAGFLAGRRALGGTTACSYTCCVPFPLPPLQQRFPEITWLPYDEPSRARAIGDCDVWLGLGGSPFQSAQSRWFVDHLIGDAALCARAGKRMFFLGVSVQSAGELDAADLRQLAAQAAAIWTRDPASADRLRAVPGTHDVVAGSDLAHIHFQTTPPPIARPGRITVVANFDYGTWPGQSACLSALARLAATEHVWLAQESRELPGAERALHQALPPDEKSRWQLVAPDQRGAPLNDVLARWPSGEWLITSRYHAAIAGAWAGSKIVVIGTNEKLRAIARELNLPLVSSIADRAAVEAALASAQPVPRSVLDAAHDRAAQAVRDFFTRARAAA